MLKRINEWAAYTSDVPVSEIEGAMRRLQRSAKLFLPPEPDDEDEPIEFVPNTKRAGLENSQDEPIMNDLKARIKALLSEIEYMST